MYAPHPSVVPYEMCSAGAVVVTNCYGNRDAAYFSAISGNFVPCQPDVHSAAEAIQRAVVQVANHPDRVAAAYRPLQTKWADVFNQSFIEACERGLNGRRSLDGPADQRSAGNRKARNRKARGERMHE